MMALMLSGLELSETYLMPGKVEKAEGLNSIEGRAASMRVVTEDFLDPDRQAKLNPIATAASRTITYANPVWLRPKSAPSRPS